jgi:predicted acetyltransferase
MRKLKRLFKKYEDHGIQVSLIVIPAKEDLKIFYKGRLMESSPSGLYLVVKEDNLKESTFNLDKGDECFTTTLPPSLLKTNSYFYFKDNYQRIDNNLNAYYVINEGDTYKKRVDRSKNQILQLKKYKHRGVNVAIISPQEEELLELRYSGELINNHPEELFLYIYHKCETEFSTYKMQKDESNFKIQIRPEEISYCQFYFMDNKGGTDDNFEKCYRFSNKRTMERIIGNIPFDHAMDYLFCALGSSKITD